jgi:carbon storage regulator
MLVLSRRVSERIVIGDDITITVTRISGNRVALGIEAPENMRILRGELEPFATAFEDAPQEAPAVPHILDATLPIPTETSHFPR